MRVGQAHTYGVKAVLQNVEYLVSYQERFYIVLKSVAVGIRFSVIRANSFSWSAVNPSPSVSLGSLGSNSPAYPVG